MTWSAQDIALVITTSATALTAIGGVILPLSNARKDHRTEMNTAVHGTFERLLDYALLEALNWGINIRNRVFFIQKLNISQEAGLTIEEEKFSDKFELARLRLQFFGKSHGFDFSKLTQLLAARTLAYAPLWYNADSTELQRNEALLDCQKVETSLNEQILAEIDRLWVELRASYPI